VQLKERFKLPPRRTNKDPSVLVVLWLNSQGVLCFLFFYNVFSFIIYRETNDVRMASSLASGMIIQYLTTCIACLILAFMRSWALTLVILSAVLILMLIQGLSQGFASPLLTHEREQTGIGATIIDRAIAAIATVKAFNAADMESQRANVSFLRLKKAATMLNRIWGTTSGIAQFMMLACLIATSNLQVCIPQFITLAKGKFAMVALLTLVGDTPSSSPPSDAHPMSPTSPNSLNTVVHSTTRKSCTLRKITPARCYGELALHNVTFAYPSRPTVPVLSDVSLFLPANEATFIIGSSGSGKSTVAQLLLRMYEPQSGTISLDEQDACTSTGSETTQREVIKHLAPSGKTP
jgi:ATP-binding cassette subfamily B (MDR/TAP) protein 1